MIRVHNAIEEYPLFVDSLDNSFLRSRLIETLKGTASVKLDSLGWFIRRPEGTWQGAGGIYKPDSTLGRMIESALEEKRKSIG